MPLVDDAVQGFSVRWYTHKDLVELSHPDGRKITLTKEEAKVLSEMLAKGVR